jgi:DNA (cytosine-5)-methyltransferase 1
MTSSWAPWWRFCAAFSPGGRPRAAIELSESPVSLWSARAPRGAQVAIGRNNVAVRSREDRVHRGRVVGLFAGIGGIELGLQRAGFESELFSEIDPAAAQILRRHFPGIEIKPDVTKLRRIPKVEVIAGGFPCQDLSQAGGKVGIHGTRSGLVGEVFRLAESNHLRSSWLVLENVSYMLRLDRGRAMSYLTDELDAMGFAWAYRTIDARAFGLPQRRKRVLLVASRVHDPRPVLFGEESQPPPDLDVIGAADRDAYGFYWTEGLRGLGWAEEATPTVKGGSTIGIPSPPAVWQPGRDFFGVPSIRDLERLQGFPADWTQFENGDRRAERSRYRLVGNAVAVPVAEWLGRNLVDPGHCDVESGGRITGDKWPLAAWGAKGERYSAEASEWPQCTLGVLSSFLTDELTPLSVRAAAGFRGRAERGKLRFADGFLPSMDRYIATRKKLPALDSVVEVA